MLFLMLACSPSYVILDNKDSGSFSEGTDSGSTDTGTEMTAEEDAYWAGTYLVVNTPQSGAFLPLGEMASFSATVYDATGQPTDFDDIQWASSLDTAWSIAGAAVDDDTLSAGKHTLTAQALLPNGDRLSYAVGGVLVQSIYAGVYTGTLNMTAAYDAYSVGCAGAATITIDATGQAVTGDASCMLSLQGFDLNGNFLLDLSNDLGTVSGDTNLDLSFFQFPLPTSGTVDENGNFSASFATQINIGTPLDVSGEFTAVRVTRDVGL